MQRFVLFFNWWLIPYLLLAQADSLHRGRLRTVVVATSVVYAGAMTGLYQIWYKENGLKGFRFYDDTGDWLQHDKIGHSYSAYQQGVLGYHALRWAGVSERKAAIFGGGLGVLMQTPIEVLDGMSPDWGASVGDLIANTAGSALFVGQQLAWQEQRVRMKFSFTPSTYADLRPGKFGESFWSRLVMDYNGQTYWLSASPHRFGWGKLPKWLCMSVGYGIDGVLGNAKNPAFSRGEPLPSFERRRQFYLSLDVDFEAIPTDSRFLKTLFVGLNMIKVPAPALRWANKGGGWRLLPFYF
ncbi:MAG: DUF2279 domain-containing protein [Bernardetiaceae bacterium]